MCLSGILHWLSGESRTTTIRILQIVNIFITFVDIYAKKLTGKEMKKIKNNC